MPDLLDQLIAAVDAKEKASTIAMIKTADGFVSVPRDTLEEEFGELSEIEKRTLATDMGDVQVPVYEAKVTEAEKEAQAKRATEYKIAVKERGAVTMPKKWRDLKATDEDFGDPTNYKFYLGDAEHVRAALSRWADASIREQYSADEQSVIKSRIDAAAKKFNIEVNKGAPDGATKGVPLEIGGETFHVAEEADRLGRTTYRFTHGDNVDPSAETYGLIYRGQIATLRCPKETTHAEVQRLMSLLAQHKSAAEDHSFAAMYQKTSGLDGATALDAAWLAFCSTVAEQWLDPSKDVTHETIKATFEEFGAVVREQAADPAQFVTLAAGAVRSKAGARLSKRDRDRITGIIRDLTEYLGETPSNNGNGNKSGEHSSSAGNGNGDLLSELHAVKEEIKSLGEKHDKAVQQNQELDRKLAERDALLRDQGLKPRPDPMASGQTKGQVTTGGSTYDVPISTKGVYGE